MTHSGSPNSKRTPPGTIGNLKQLDNIASSHDGKCLSGVYKNCKERLLWQCSFGHKWLATPFSIKIRKSWCPVCAGNRPFGMETMHKLAQEYKGQCLSKKYVNCKTKMLWKCSNGHEFIATPESIRQGRWCPYCRNTDNDNFRQDLIGLHSRAISGPVEI